MTRRKIGDCMNSISDQFKQVTTSEQRNRNPYYHIDSGFINHRKCFSILGQTQLDRYNRLKRPTDEQMAGVLNDNLLITILVSLCRENSIKTLGETLFELEEGKLICSTEQIEGNAKVYKEPRIRSKIILPYDFDKQVFLEYSTKYISSDTCKLELKKGAKLSMISEIREITQKEIILHPLVMGAPTFDHWNNKDIGINLTFFGWSWYETFPEDIDEFTKCTEVQNLKTNEWMDYMKACKEVEVKHKFCQILNELPKKDWAGEQDDLFTTTLHLSGSRTSAAFLLKGPSNFGEMMPRHLGRQGDQIYRLACTPASLLVVQHCHRIGEAVRSQLRAFAVNPANPRRYCLIDGQDTYRIFKALNAL